MRPAYVCGPQFTIDDQLLDRSGVTTPRPGPLRRDQTVVGQKTAPFRLLMGGDVGEDGTDLVGERLSIGGEIDCGRAAGAAAGGGGGTGAPLPRAAAQQRSQCDSSLQVQVDVVLPREPDAAEHLDAILCALEEPFRCERAGDGGGEAAFVVRLARAGRIPRDGAGLLEAEEHVGAAML